VDVVAYPGDAPDLSVLDPDRERDGPHPVGELAAEPAEQIRFPVGGLVVDSNPAVARRRDHGPLRAGRAPRDALLDGTPDRADVVGLDVDRSEARASRLRRGEPAAELADLDHERQRLVTEAPGGICSARRRVGRVDGERHVRRAAGRERLGNRLGERGGHALPARLRPDVDVGQQSARPVLPPRQREAGDLPVLLGDEGEPVPEQGPPPIGFAGCARRARDHAEVRGQQRQAAGRKEGQQPETQREQRRKKRELARVHLLLILREARKFVPLGTRL